MPLPAPLMCNLANTMPQYPIFPPLAGPSQPMIPNHTYHPDYGPYLFSNPHALNTTSREKTFWPCGKAKQGTERPESQESHQVHKASHFPLKRHYWYDYEKAESHQKGN
jgi:hypothetical protein